MGLLYLLLKTAFSVKSPSLKFWKTLSDSENHGQIIYVCINVMVDIGHDLRVALVVKVVLDFECNNLPFD